MKSNLPKGWALTSLGAICQKAESFSPTNTPQSKFHYIDIASIDNSIYRVVDAKEYNGKDAPSRARQLVYTADTLISTVRPYLRKIAFITEELNGQIASTGFTVVRVKEGIDPKYVFYNAISDDFINSLCEKQRGASYPAVRDSDVFEQQIPLPPLAEQARIVAQLDAAMQQVEASQERIDKLPVILKQFRQAVLAAAVSGRLTETWRVENPTKETAADFLDEIIAGRKTRFIEACAEAAALGKKKPRKIFLEELPEVDTSLLPELPSNWTATTVGFLAHVTKLAGFEYTNHIKYQEQGDIPVVRAQNVQMGHFSEENLVYIDLATSDFLERSQLHGREVLMVFIGAGTGNVCLTPKNRRWHLAPNVAKIDCDVMLPEYLNYYLQSPVGLRNTLSFVKATAQPSLSMETIREVAVAVPTLTEQQEIVRQINHYFNLAAQLELRFEQAAALVEQLPQSLLKKALSGQLVPQDPNDEPANILLERLKIATAKSPEKGRGKVKTKTATAAGTNQTGRKMKGKPVKSLPEFVERLSQMGGKAQPKQLLIEFDLQEDVDSFFELLREGKGKGILHVPTGENGQVELT